MSNVLSRRSFIGSAAGAAGAAAVAALGGMASGTAIAGEAAPAAAGATATATATAMGFGGEVSVTVTVDTESGAVLDVAIIGESETPDKGGRAIEALQPAMVEAASVEVDSFAGASVTSAAVLDAASHAYAEATGTAGEATGLMAPGTYQGSALGYNALMQLPVEVTVSSDAILSIKLPDVPTERFSHGETELALQAVIDDFVPRVLEHQSIAVDAASGASISSGATRLAIEEALTKAFEAAGSPASCVERFKVIPEIVAPEETIELDVDVLVVGLGSGGIMAMKSACETMQAINPRIHAGGRVSILGIERSSKIGGKSELTHVGCAANPPKMMELANGGEPFIDESVWRAAWDAIVTDENGNYLAKPEVIDMFFEESGKTIDWLYDNGYTWGNMHPAQDWLGGAIEWNIATNEIGDEGTFEDRRRMRRLYDKAMLDEVCKQGGSYMLNTEGYEIIMEDDRVAGVKARNLRTKQEYVIHAKAVIMNTGGFINNPEMIERYYSEKWAGERRYLGFGQDTGAMIQAAIDAGAGTFNIDMPPIVMTRSVDHFLTQYPVHFFEDQLWMQWGRYMPWTLNNIPLVMAGISDNVGVNKKGERYFDEAHWGWYQTCTETDGWPYFASGNYYWSIVSDDNLRVVANEGLGDNVAIWEFFATQGVLPLGTPIPEVYEVMDVAVDEGLAVKADSIEELAELMGIEPATLATTIADYNAMCDAGEDTQCGKPVEFLRKLETAPFYAIKVFAGGLGTDAALDVNEKIEVLRTDGVTPMGGLYAVGLDSMGVVQNPNRNYVGFGGVAQGWLWTSSRMAGINAVNYIKDTFGEFNTVSFVSCPVPEEQPDIYKG